MGKIVLYHGSTVSIEHPLANVGRDGDTLSELQNRQ
jgi:hypothetical protein